MIVCSCNVLSEQELRRAVAGLRTKDPCAVITPGRALHTVGKRIRCHGCLKTLFEIIAAEDTPRRRGRRRPESTEDEA